MQLLQRSCDVAVQPEHCDHPWNPPETRAARDLSDLETQARTAPKETDKDDVVADLERRLAGLAADTDANGVLLQASAQMQGVQLNQKI